MESNVTKVEIFGGNDGQWYFRAKAGNGKIVSQSEGYTRQYDATQAAKDVFPDAEVVGGSQTEANQDQEEPAGEPAESNGDEEGQEDSGEQAEGSEAEPEPSNA